MTTTTAGCGKRRHPDELTAIAAALRCSRTRGVPLRVYLCPTCAGWHLTKRPEWSA